MILIDKYFFYKSTPRLLIFVLAMLFAGSVWGQASDYSFSTVTNASLYDMSTGTTDLLATGTYRDDVASAATNIGFTFSFMGTNYTQFSINSNGQMRLGGTVISGIAQGVSSDVAVIAPISGDNSIQSTGKVHYKLFGSSPNRYLVVEWVDLRIPYASETGTTYCKFQAVLFETSNIIEFIYGKMYNMGTSTSSRGVFISSSNTTGTIGQITDITTTPVYNTSGTSITTSSFGASSNMTNLNSESDGNRRKFVFTPNTCISPSGTAASSITATTATISWTAPSSSPSSGYEYEVRTSGIAGSGTTGLTTSGTTAAGVVTKDLTGLSSSTTYSVYIRSNCGSGDYSGWTGVYNFTTELVVGLPYSEPFTTTSTPSGYNISGWSISSIRGVTGNPGNNIYKNLWSSATTGEFITLNIGTIVSGTKLSFDYKHSNYDSPYDSPGTGTGSFQVQISTNYGGSFSTIATINNDASSTWRNLEYNLNSYVGQNVKIKIVGNWISGDYDLAFDNIKVESPCTPPTIESTTPASRCGTGTLTLEATASSGTLNWYSASSGGSSLGTGTSFTTPSISTTTSYWVDATDGCTSARTEVIATVNNTPETPGTISGTTPQCPAQTAQEYSISSVSGATSYNWTVPTGWSITSGSSSASIQVTTGSAGQNGDISVTAENACGTSAAQTKAVTVVSTPATPGSITGTTAQCPGLTSQEYSIAAVSGATSYNWTVPSGWSITGGTGTATIQVTTGTAGQNGNIQVTAQNTCGTSSAQTLAVTVENGTPATPTSNAFSNLGSTSFTANWSAATNATSYRLDVSTVSDFASFVGAFENLDVGNVTTYSVTGLATGTKYYYRVRAVNSCGTSSSSSTQTAFTKKYLFTVGSGQEYATIQSAMDDVYNCWQTTAFDADVEVRVFNGTYTEAVTSNSALAPGASGRLLIKAASGNSPIIDGGSSRARGIDMSESYVTISGLTVRNHTADGIKIAGGNNIVENNTVHNNAVYNIIIFGGGNNNEVAYNKCYGSAEAGIWVTASSSANIHHNLCYDHTKYGIYLSASANSAVVKNNTLHGNGSGGTTTETWTDGFETDKGWSFSAGTGVSSRGTPYTTNCSGSCVTGSARGGSNVLNLANCNHDITTSASITLQVATGGGTFSGFYKIGSEASYDYFVYSINGSPVRTTNQIASGCTDTWTTFSFAVPAGNNTITLAYMTDGTVTSSGGKIWIDDVQCTNIEVPGTATGSGLQIASSTNITSTNNIMYAKTGGDYYAVYVDGSSSLTTSSGWNNIYTTGSKLGFYGSDQNTIGNWNTATPGSNDDISADPLFVTNGSDFHLKSEAASGTYTGGSWPPSTESGGTWTQYSGQHSPSIDAGNPADPFANESAYNGGRINQGCYGNTAQASRTGSDNNSLAEAPTSQVNAGDISSVANNSSSAVPVFSFKISDLGSLGDGQATKVTQVRIKKAGGTADWTDHIAGAQLFSGASQITTGTPVITDDDITFPITLGNLDVANGTNSEITLKIWLNTTNIIDNSTMQFMISQTSHDFEAHSSGSTFATDFGSAITGNTMTVRVTATKLIFADNMPPAIVPLNTGFPVKVLAVDDNNNLDSSATNSVTLSVYAPGTEILSSPSGLTQNIDYGTYQWNDVSYNTAQEFKIRATASGLTEGISILINCIDVPGGFSITAPINANSCNGNITISWNASSGATSYDLYYSTGFDSDPQSCLSPLTNISSPYTFNASSPLTLYKFQILASNIVGQTWSTNVGSDSTRSSHAWIGGTSTDWTNTNNWCGGSIPNSSSDVIIFPGTLFQPTLTATSNVRNLTIETGASINAGSQNINVYGNWLNHGTLSGTGTVTFTGTAPTQTIENGNQEFYNLEVNKSSGSVVLNNDAVLKNNVTITAGTLDANNFDITLEGNWNNSGNFMAQSGTVNFIGTGTSTITRVGSPETIFFDGFENGNQGWTMQSISSVADWKIQTGSANTGSYALGTYDLSSNTPNDYCRTCDMFYAIDVSRMIDLELYTNPSISFNYRQGSSSGGGLAGMVFLDGDLIFSNNILRSSFVSSGDISINSYSGKKDLQLVFRLYVGNKTGLNDPGFIIDDLTIIASPNFELFNNVVFNKSGGAVQLNSDIVSENEFLISNGTLNANGKIIRSKGDFINNGTFAHGNGDVQFNGNSIQHIKGSSNIGLYKMTKNGSGELIVGDDANNITITAENSFDWINNEDKITVGNGTETSLIINDNLFIGANCQLETQNNSTVSVLNHYKNFGIYTPNDGTIKFHNNVPSTIIKEPASTIYYENFESGSTGWTLGSVAGSDWRRQEGFGHKSNWDLAIYDNDYGFSHGYCYDCATNVVDASKVINLSGYNSVRLNFAYRIGGNSNDYGQVIIKVGSTEHVILDNLYNKLMWYEAETIDISEYANQSVTLIFRFKVSGLTPGAADPGFCIDEVLITTTSVHTETFNNLEINKLDNKSTTLWCPIIVNGNVLINQGDLNSAGYSFPVAGNWTANGSSTFTHNNNTITFNGSQNQTIINGASTSFYNIIINKTGTASLSSNTLKLDNNLTLTSGTLNSGNQNIEISGHWLNNGGVFEPMSQQVLFKGLSDQNITSRNGTDNPFYTIEMNKEGVLKLQDSLTLNKDLKLIKGLLDVNSTNNIRLKGDWIVGDGTTLGIFNPGSAMVTFDGIAPQHINRRTNGQTNLNDFTFFDVKIDGSNVTLWLKSSDYKINMNSLYIVKDKEFNVEGQE